jgi:epoxyqueuosine reductase
VVVPPAEAEPPRRAAAEKEVAVTDPAAGAAAARRRLALHVCCAPCATHPVEVLCRDWDVLLFFSNSNISPESEFQRRLAAAEPLAERTGCPLFVDPYDHDAWRAFVAGLEPEPERGRRCLKCFEFSLARTAAFAREHDCAAFTSTLTISPHKRSADIFRVGTALGPYLCVDFKKRNGFARSLEMSRALGLYRQGYCGCEFSRHGAGGV